MPDEVMGVRAVFEFKDFGEQVTKYEKRLEEAELATEKYAKDVEGSYDISTKAVTDHVEVTIDSLRDLRWRIITMMFFMRTAAQVISGAWQMMEAARESSLDAASTQALARAYGIEVDSVVQDLKELSGAALTTKEALAIANQGILADQGQFATSYSELWQTAVISARASGKEAVDVFSEIVQAIKEGDAEALEAATPFNNLESAVQAYAEAQGVAAEEVEESVVQQILLQRTLEDTSILMSSGASAASSQADGIAGLSDAWDTFLKSANAIVDWGKVTSFVFDAVADGIDIVTQGILIERAAVEGLLNIWRNYRETLDGTMTVREAFFEGTSDFIQEYQDKMKGLEDVQQGAGFRQDILAGPEGDPDIFGTEGTLKSLQSAIASYEQLRSKHLQRIADIDARYLKDVENITQSFNDDISDIHEDYADKVTDIQEKYTDRMFDINQQHNDQLVKAAQRYSDEMIDAEISMVNARERAIRAANNRISDLRDSEGQKEYNDLAKHLLRMQQAREKFVLNRVQSEREYQYNRNRLIAEGDVLAIEDLDARHGFEQLSDEENLDLRLKQMQDSFELQRKLRQDDLNNQIDDIRLALERQLLEISIRDQQRRANIQREYDRDLRDAAQQRERARRDASQDAFRDIADAAERRDKRLAQNEEEYQEDLQKAADRRDEKNAAEDADFLERQKKWAEHWVEIEKATELGITGVYDIFKAYFGEGEQLDQLYAAFYARREREASILETMLAKLRGEYDQIVPGIGPNDPGFIGPQNQRPFIGPQQQGEMNLQWQGAPIQLQVTGPEGQSLNLDDQTMDQLLQAVMVTLTTQLREVR
jgi:hypothetical protein